MMSPAEFVRMPKGFTQTYLLYQGEESAFLKKLATYAMRAEAKVEHDIWICIRQRDDAVQRMVVCKITKAGNQLKRQRRKHAA